MEEIFIIERPNNHITYENAISMTTEQIEKHMEYYDFHKGDSFIIDKKPDIYQVVGHISIEENGEEQFCLIYEDKEKVETAVNYDRCIFLITPFQMIQEINRNVSAFQLSNFSNEWIVICYDNVYKDLELCEVLWKAYLSECIPRIRLNRR